MRVHGRLLIDAARPPELGTLEIEGGRIVGMRFGEFNGDWDAGADVGGRDRLIVPAFTDAHFHVPQIDSVGCDGMELLEWLNRVIFPAEAWWGRGGAVANARTAARRLIEHGTAGVAGYLTSHAEGSREAVELWALRTGLRFHLGRSAMDREGPEELIAEDVERQRMSPMPSPLLAEVGGDEVVPAGGRPRRNVSANPRFAVSCTEELLAEIGWAVKARDESSRWGTFVQTHIAESLGECARVRELFPDAEDYVDVYDRAGLVHERTLLAHCLHLSEREWGVLAERDAVAVHCPTANVFLSAGVFDLGAARDAGVRVALGSDVAAGADVAMPRVARAMIEAAKYRRLLSGGAVHVPTPGEAWELITAGNAAALGWADAGVLAEGAMADVLVLRAPETWFDDFLVGRLVYGWESSLIEARVIGGVVADPALV